MSRLWNPGLGEIADRLTILALKIVVGRLNAKEIGHFEQEADGLQVRLPSLDPSATGHLLALAAVNGVLWQKTDQLREWSEAYDEMDSDTVARLGIEILKLNDLRAKIVGMLNDQAGQSFEEKQR